MPHLHQHLELQQEQRAAGPLKAVATCNLQPEHLAVLPPQAFLHWAEGQQAGWVEAHIESWANLAGPTLGLPKAVSALLSGAHVRPAAVQQAVWATARVWGFVVAAVAACAAGLWHTCADSSGVLHAPAMCSDQHVAADGMMLPPASAQACA